MKRFVPGSDVTTVVIQAISSFSVSIVYRATCLVSSHPPQWDSKFRFEVRCCCVVHRCQLLDLPWEDVLVPHVLCYLPLQHLVSLQRVSKQFHSLIQVYLANCRTFDPSSVSQPYIMLYICN